MGQWLHFLGWLFISISYIRFFTWAVSINISQPYKMGEVLGSYGLPISMAFRLWITQICGLIPSIACLNYPCDVPHIKLFVPIKKKKKKYWIFNDCQELVGSDGQCANHLLLWACNMSSHNSQLTP